MERYGPWPAIVMPTLTGRTREELKPAGTVTAPIPATVAGGFAAACRRVGVSVYSAYLTTACMALAALQPQGEGFGVDIVSASRSWPGTADLIGFFSDYLTLGIGKLPTAFDPAARRVHTSIAHALRHDRVPRAEIMRRFAPDAGSFPTWPNVLFERLLDRTAWDIELANGRLVDIGPVRKPKPMRRYPGLRWLVLDDRRTATITLECEYALDECERSLVEQLVGGWADRIAAVARGS